MTIAAPAGIWLEKVRPNCKAKLRPHAHCGIVLLEEQVCAPTINEMIGLDHEFRYKEIGDRNVERGLSAGKLRGFIKANLAAADEKRGSWNPLAHKRCRLDAGRRFGLTTTDSKKIVAIVRQYSIANAELQKATLDDRIGTLERSGSGSELIGAVALDVGTRDKAYERLIAAVNPDHPGGYTLARRRMAVREFVLRPREQRSFLIGDVTVSILSAREEIDIVEVETQRPVELMTAAVAAVISFGWRR